MDHDLIPMENIELGRILGDQPLYGHQIVSNWNAWSLRAEYCLYDFSAVRHLPLNFLNDFSNSLVTGGRNWFSLYKNHDPHRLRLATVQSTKVKDPLDGSTRCIQTMDDRWIHLGGISYGDRYKKNFDFYERIAKASDEGATLQMLTVKEA